MRILNDTEICKASGGVFGLFTGIIMGSLDYNIKPTVMISSTVECVTYSLGYVSYLGPSVVFGLPQLIPVALIGAGLGYIGHELARAFNE